MRVSSSLITGLTGLAALALATSLGTATAEALAKAAALIP